MTDTLQSPLAERDQARPSPLAERDEAPLLASTLAAIAPVDDAAFTAAVARQDTLTKPPGSLGRLEEVGNRLAAIAGTCPPPVPRHPFATIFAGDHGVVAQGVSPWPQSVTIEMLRTMLAGRSAIGALAAELGVELVVTDVGVAGDTSELPGLLHRRVRYGTDDLSLGPAMTRHDALAAMEVGIDTVDAAVARAGDVLLTGEMGIGNTTASAALIGAFTGLPASTVVGRGAGSDDAMLARKTDAVARALARPLPDSAADPVGVLAELGGLEIAAIAGSILGAAAHRVPVLVDGVIAAAAALVAVALSPEVRGYLFASHRGVEPGIVAALSALGLEPLVDLGLRLGEATGAVMALPTLRAGAAILSGMATFTEADVNAGIQNGVRP